MTTKTTEQEQQQRNILQKELENLLGFEDGASDVLDHLLTIESSEDLLDYLSQLLGTANTAVKQLVEHVGKFQNGQVILLPDELNDDKYDTKPSGAVAGTGTSNPNSSTTKPSAPSSGPTTTTTKNATFPKTQNSKPKPSNTNKSKHSNKKPPPPPPSQKKQSAQPSSSKSGTTSTPQQQSFPATPAESSNATTPQPQMEQATTKAPPPKSHPTRGTPKFVCGCFGTFHKPLTNCLFCGRISCEKEGYDYCAFCGYRIERVTTAGGSSAAIQHKERLLRFDREYAQRTVVLDDQADYFTMQSLQWMESDQERQDHLEREQERLEQAGKQGPMKLQLNF